MNAPNPFDSYVLGEGEEKIKVVEDPKIPNAATIYLNKENHTAGGMLRSQLLLLPYVLYAGYKVPHPLEPRVVIKVQTNEDHSPIQAIQDACRNLIMILSNMREGFSRNVLLYRRLKGDLQSDPQTGADDFFHDSRDGFDLGV